MTRFPLIAASAAGIPVSRFHIRRCRNRSGGWKAVTKSRAARRNRRMGCLKTRSGHRPARLAVAAELVTPSPRPRSAGWRFQPSALAAARVATGKSVLHTTGSPVVPGCTRRGEQGGCRRRHPAGGPAHATRARKNVCRERCRLRRSIVNIPAMRRLFACLVLLISSSVFAELHLRPGEKMQRGHRGLSSQGSARGCHRRRAIQDA